MARKYIPTEIELKKIINMYNDGKSLRQMSKELNKTRKILSGILKEQNIAIRTTTITSRKYIHDINFFENIDNENKAYWLGFLYADGFIESKRKNGNQKFGVTLSIKDIRHLEKFKKDLKATNGIKIYTGSGYAKTNKFCKLLLTSQNTVNDLIKHGCVENKTNILTFPNFLEKELVSHFIRGYFDGDGSVTFNKTKQVVSVSFVGTKEFLEGIKEYFNLDNKLYHYPNSQTYQLKIGGNKKPYRLLHNMYKNANMFLDRKYEIYKDIHYKYSES